MRYVIKLFQNSKGEFSKTALYFFIVFVISFAWIVLYVFFPQRIAVPDKGLILGLLTLFASLYWGRRATEAWERRPYVPRWPAPPAGNIYVARKDVKNE